MTVQATFTYTLDNATGQAESCTLTWGAVHGMHLHGVLGGAGTGACWAWRAPPPPLLPALC